MFIVLIFSKMFNLYKYLKKYSRNKYEKYLNLVYLKFAFEIIQKKLTYNKKLKCD